MSKLESVLLQLTAMYSAKREAVGFVPGGRALLLVTVAYLVAMLSVPLPALSMLIWFAIYPVVGATLICGEFGTVFRRSLIVLPFVLAIGIFNPIFDREPAITIGHIVISRGWVTFISLTLRGLFAVQALLILITVKGFNGLCMSLRDFRVPAIFVTQLQMVYRYMNVLLQEALNMLRARMARGYGRKALPIKDWGPFTGQLFLRTIRRSRRIHAAMTARGFTGTMPRYATSSERWGRFDTCFCVVCIALFAFLRVFNFSALF